MIKAGSKVTQRQLGMVTRKCLKIVLYLLVSFCKEKYLFAEIDGWKVTSSPLTERKDYSTDVL